jgi:hypothetical protein
MNYRRVTSVDKRQVGNGAGENARKKVGEGAGPEHHVDWRRRPVAAGHASATATAHHSTWRAPTSPDVEVLRDPVDAPPSTSDGPPHARRDTRRGSTRQAGSRASGRHAVARDVRPTPPSSCFFSPPSPAWIARVLTYSAAPFGSASPSRYIRTAPPRTPSSFIHKAKPTSRESILSLIRSFLEFSRVFSCTTDRSRSWRTRGTPSPSRPARPIRWR